MALLGFFDTKDLEAFAGSLASDLGRRFPPSSEARTDAGAEKQLAVILDGLAVRAVRYHEQHNLGVYRKAKLGNVFKWKLAEMGYSQGFVDRATKVLVTRLAMK
jgi:hypothetical protein